MFCEDLSLHYDCASHYNCKPLEMYYEIQV